MACEPVWYLKYISLVSSVGQPISKSSCTCSCTSLELILLQNTSKVTVINFDTFTELQHDGTHTLKTIKQDVFYPNLIINI